MVPFAFFLPQPCGVAGLITIAFQLSLIVSGNLSWLNWLTLVLAFSNARRSLAVLAAGVDAIVASQIAG